VDAALPAIMNYSRHSMWSMNQGPLLIDTSRRRKPNPVAGPILLVTLPPWHKVFFRNLRDLFWRPRKPPLWVVSRSGSFWPDVFVSTRLPWNRFLQSALGHIVVIAAVWGSSRFFPELWPQPAQIVPRSVFHGSDVIYYEASEYVAPLDTGGTHVQVAKKGDPAHAPQPIISVPPEADNRTQTIVAPPMLKLDHDVPLPNVVALGNPTLRIPPAAVTSAPSDLKLSALPTPVIAPPPDVKSELKQTPTLSASVVAPAPEVDAAISRRAVHAPQASIVEPPPVVENRASSRLTDINIGRAQVVAPAPQLPMGEQHASANMAALGNTGAGVVPPPPSVQGSGTAGNGRLIALNLHPTAPGGPVDPPAGNRRGTFAATPQGKPGATGTPDIPADNHHAAAGGRDKLGAGNSPSGLPSGLYVGTGPKPANNSVAGDPSGAFKANSPLLASATPPRVTAVPPRSSEMPSTPTSELERKVFGYRKSYSMILDVPNLNSAGGSWVMHFVELKDAEKQGELVAPVATQQVDPGYPLELMKQNVHGAVVLSAVIRSDGSVGEVQILRGVDDRLDQYASAALARWRFRPATRNGEAVALQAVVIIPFRPMRKPGF
jgi:TonB family protein